MSFQVLYQASDRLVIGVGPFEDGADYTPDYIILELDDGQQGAVLAPTAYVCADDMTVSPEPC